MAFDNLESALDADTDAESGDNNTADDVERNPRMKITPPAVIGGELVDVMFLGDISEPQNVQGSDDWRDHGDFVVTLRNPEVVEGEVFEAAGRRETDSGTVAEMDEPFIDGVRRPNRDFMLVQEDWEAHRNVEESVEKIDGEYQPVGIETYGTQFVGEPADLTEALDATGHDAVDIFIPGDAGRAIAHSIDAAPRKSAFIRDNGEKATGLIEYPDNYGTDEYSPAEDDDYPRVAAPPVVHPDLEGEDVAIVMHYGDIETALDGGVEDDEEGGYRRHFGDVILETESGSQLISRGDGVLDPAWDTVEDRPVYLTFEEPDGGWGDDETETTDDETETTDDGDSTFAALEEATTEQTGLTLDDLDSRTREFVKQVGELAAQQGGVDAAIGDFEETVEASQENDEISDEFTAGELRPLVEDVAA